MVASANSALKSLTHSNGFPFCAIRRKASISSETTDQASASVTRESVRNDDPEKSAAPADGVPVETKKSDWNKPRRFCLAFFCLLLMVLMVSIDGTALGVAIPVSKPFYSWRYQPTLMRSADFDDRAPRHISVSVLDQYFLHADRGNRSTHLCLGFRHPRTKATALLRIYTLWHRLRLCASLS